VENSKNRPFQAIFTTPIYTIKKPAKAGFFVEILMIKAMAIC